MAAFGAVAVGSDDGDSDFDHSCSLFDYVPDESQLRITKFFKIQVQKNGQTTINKFFRKKYVAAKAVPHLVQTRFVKKIFVVISKDMTKSFQPSWLAKMSEPVPFCPASQAHVETNAATTPSATLSTADGPEPSTQKTLDFMLTSSQQVQSDNGGDEAREASRAKEVSMQRGGPEMRFMLRSGRLRLHRLRRLPSGLSDCSVKSESLSYSSESPQTSFPATDSQTTVNGEDELEFLADMVKNNTSAV